MMEPAMTSEQMEAHMQRTKYVQTWAMLVALLIVSVLGSMSGVHWLVLVAAFGVAGAKSYLVARNFMHVNVEKRWILYLMLVCVSFLVVLFAGVAPDVTKHGGLNWSNEAAKHAVETGPSAESLKHE
jgi:caa(3)-type oxidase subunit IV